MDWEPDPQTSHRERGHELTLLFAPFEMYFHFENGYDPSDLVVQIRQEKKVAKDIGLTQRSHFQANVLPSSHTALMYPQTPNNPGNFGRNFIVYSQVKTEVTAMFS